MNRAQAAAHLDSQFNWLATEISQVATDDSALGYGPDIDQALRKMGTSEDDIATATVTGSDVEEFLALVEYYALNRLRRAVAFRVNVNINGSVQASESDMFKHLTTLVEEAQAICSGYGYTVGQAPEWSYGTINLDMIEPEPS